MKTNEFTVNGIKIKVVKVNKTIAWESNKYYAEAFDLSLNSGYMLRKQVEKVLEERGLNDFSSEYAKSDDLYKQLKELEIKLRRGVVGTRRMTKEEGKQIALEMRKIRKDLNSVGDDNSAYFNNTVEYYAENERLQYLLYACTVHADSGERYWKSFEAFKNAPESDNELISKAMTALISNESGVSLEKKDTYEESWLKRMKIVNELGQFINDKGQAVDEEGRLINSEGRFIDENGNFIDAYGNKVDKDGALLEPDTWVESSQE